MYIKRIFNKGYLKRNISRIPLFYRQWRLYGFSVAFWSLLLPLHHIFERLRLFLAARKHRAILLYLRKRYNSILVKPANNNTASNAIIEPEATIWVCWWDGEEAMPPLVKICYNTIRQRAGTHPVQLVTKYNVHGFVSIPEYILKKVNAKIITITHFTDILRANLLYEYGGIWMDATILVLKDISFENMPFYTLKTPASKTDSVTLAAFAGLTNKSMRPVNQASPEISRWSSFMLAGTRHSPVFEYFKDILHAYWKEHNEQIEYLLIDYIFALCYDNIPVIKKLIDDVPCGETEHFVLEKSLNNEFSEEQFAQYSLTVFHKLTWKKHFDIYTKDNKLTIYGHLLNTYNSGER